MPVFKEEETRLRRKQGEVSPRRPPPAPHKSPNPHARSRVHREQSHPEYQRLAVLGRGSTSVVMQVRHVDGTCYALKETKPKTVTGIDEEGQAIKLHKSLPSHPNLLALIDFWQENEDTWLQVLELCTVSLDRWLASHIQRPDFLPEYRVWSFIRDIAAGLDCIHQAGMIHCDIKPPNILVSITGDGSTILKIADFGLLCTEPNEEKVGDPAYLSPECTFPMCNVTPKGDIYAFGLTVFEILYDVHMPNNGIVHSQMRQGWQACLDLGREHRPDVSEPLLHLLSRMLDPNEALRPTAEEILKIASARLQDIPPPAIPTALPGEVHDDENVSAILPKHPYDDVPSSSASSLLSPPPIGPKSPSEPAFRKRPRPIPFSPDILARCSDDNRLSNSMPSSSSSSSSSPLSASSPCPASPGRARRRSISTGSSSPARRRTPLFPVEFSFQ